MSSVRLRLAAAVVALAAGIVAAILVADFARSVLG
jgi:hypothetical protein